MILALHDIAAPMFLRGLNALSGLVDRAIASDLDEATLMDARLAPDMKPFPDQVRMASFSARSCVARLTGQEWPRTDDAEATLVELKETIALSIAFIEATDLRAFEGGETRRVELRFPGVELDFEGAGYLTSFALPNFYFHISMAYAVLRNAGIELGKRDYLSQLELV
ncbi:MAG: DUF1993 domain-containing protein [Brevundimonas sp.]|uniref:DUF1993 domain-containing protein n=1 Tax=Brevundimonas sp. TaxID=1871086 RepID=UPI002488F7AE|nr:DUF1993 domain-containing protein [Brevundimonas sp.]MDI1327059.1 DUF1993 domain-containing protein [Brevundimonas sp.]